MLFSLVLSLFGGVDDRYIIPPTPVNYASFYSTAVGRMQQNTESIQISIISMVVTLSSEFITAFRLRWFLRINWVSFFLQKRTKLKRDLLLSDGTE